MDQNHQRNFIKGFLKRNPILCSCFYTQKAEHIQFLMKTNSIKNCAYYSDFGNYFYFFFYLGEFYAPCDLYTNTNICLFCGVCWLTNWRNGSHVPCLELCTGWKKTSLFLKPRNSFDLSLTKNFNAISWKCLFWQHHSWQNLMEVIGKILLKLKGKKLIFINHFF